MFLFFYFPQHIIVNVFLSYDNDGANAWLQCKQHQHSTALKVSMRDNQNILKNGTSRICLNIFGLSD